MSATVLRRERTVTARVAVEVRLLAESFWCSFCGTRLDGDPDFHPQPDGPELDAYRCQGCGREWAVLRGDWRPTAPWP